MAAEVKPSIGERDPPLHAPPVLLVLDYPSPPHPPVFRSRKRAMVIGGPHVAFATVAGAVFMSCLDRHGMALTTWVVAMACVYVVVRTSRAKHLTAGRRVQVILATFVSFVATVGAAVTYWGRAYRFDFHVPTPACRSWLALLAAAVVWFLLARRNRPQAHRPHPPRWCWRPFERWTVRELHGHVLDGIALEASGKARMRQASAEAGGPGDGAAGALPLARERQ
jgi:hypothetical protein